MTTTAYTSEGLRRYLEIVRKHLPIAIAAMVIVPLAAFLFSVLQEPAYQATSEVLLSGENIPANLTGIPNSNGDPLTSQNVERYVQTQAGLARAPEIAERTLEAADRQDLSIDALLATSSVAPKT